MAADVFNARIAQANLIITDFDAKLSSLNRTITQNKSKHLLVESEFNTLKTFDLSYFISKSHFDDEDDTRNYLVFQPINECFKLIINSDYASSWKSKGLSSESIKPPATSDNNLTPALMYYGTRTRVKFTGRCLKQWRISYTHGKIVIIYIVYELGASSSLVNDPTLKVVYFVQLL